MFEEHIVGAKWDENGHWDPNNNRNLLYYLITGFMLPLIFGIIFWGHRSEIVAKACHSLQATGLHPPLC
jgi:membrane protease YdiL (CAAX protease family)